MAKLDDLVVLRRELLARGLTDAHIRGQLRSGVLTRIRHGAYAPSEQWRVLPLEARHQLVSRAVLRTQHETSVLSHISAAVEHGAPLWGFETDPVHITRRDGRAGRREAGVAHHRNVLSDDELTRVQGLPVTTALRSAFEVMSTTGVEPALVVVNALLNAQRFSLEELREAAPRFRHWPGTLTANIVLRLADGRIQSVGESRYCYLGWRQHLPAPVPQVPVRDEHGTVVAWLDFGYPEHRTFVEFDGRMKYTRHRRPGESLDDYLMREKRREELVSQLTGWTPVRISWTDLAHPARTADRVRAVLRSSGRAA